MTKDTTNLSIVVVGASGDLATTKIFPALFSLYCQGFLPSGFRVFGFSRTPMSHDDFRALVTEHLTCRYVPGESCTDRMNEFLASCFYHSGNYSSRESFLDLYAMMKENETSPLCNRIFYMAIPPSVFLDTAQAMAGAGLVVCGPDQSTWSRIVIEKPFGKDRESSDILTREMANVFSEDQTFRIDHYLGKEVIQNLMVLRFANLIFEPVWNRSFIERIHIDWKEDHGVGSRGRYFDEFGIIRDVIQNHLLQILALVAMEKPQDMTARHVRNEKVKVLKSISPVQLKNMVAGQYREGELKGVRQPAYTAEKFIPPDSITPTFAAAVLGVDNDRWRGVPFVITAGKGMNASTTEITIKFRQVASNIFCANPKCLPANDLVIRIQPDESIMLNIVNKEPGLSLSLVETSLNLRYQSAFQGKIPEAYECLLLDVIKGDRSLFIRSDELAAAWDIFTPVLHELEENKIKPEPYAFGSTGPAGTERLFT